jgi:hypothetical protein
MGTTSELYEKFDIESDYIPSLGEVLHINTSIKTVGESVKEILKKI